VIDSGYSSASQQESTFFRSLEIGGNSDEKDGMKRNSLNSNDIKTAMIVDEDKENNTARSKEFSDLLSSSVPLPTLSAAIGVFSDDSLLEVRKRTDKNHHPGFHGLSNGSTSSSCVSLSLLALTLPSQSTSPLWTEFGFLSAPGSPKEKEK
jgi:hypothetical protein